MKKNITILCITLGLLVACQSEPDDTSNSNQVDESIEVDQSDSKIESDEKAKPIDLQLPKVSLQKKDEGENVLALQEVLEKIGYDIPLNGIYSEATTWAITDFQLQSDHLAVTGIYDTETEEALKKIVDQDELVEAGKALPPPVEDVFTSSGSSIIENPYDLLAVVNKESALPTDYVPHDLVVPEVRFPFTEDLQKKQLRKPAAISLEKLFRAAEEAGYYLFAQSGYRSYDRQAGLFSTYSQEHGEEAANAFSARPGESEHQTGLSMDVTSEAVNYQLITDFGDTPEGIWVKENAHRFGFIIRYPEGKEDITQYQFEPWHLRYVGEKAAHEMVKNSLTLEEYFSVEN